MEAANGSFYVTLWDLHTEGHINVRDEGGMREFLEDWFQDVLPKDAYARHCIDTLEEWAQSPSFVKAPEVVAAENYLEVATQKRLVRPSVLRTLPREPSRADIHKPAVMKSDEHYLLLRDLVPADKNDLKGLVPFKAGTPESKRAAYIGKKWEVTDPRTGKLIGFDQIRVEIGFTGKRATVYVAPFDMTFIMPNMPALDKEVYRTLSEIIDFVKTYDPDLDVTYPQGAYTSPTSFPVRRASKPSWIVLSRNFNVLNAPAPTARKPQSMTLSEWARAN